MLTTERLVLRDFVPEDLAAVLAYQQKPLYLRYYPWIERTHEDVQALMHVWLAQQQESPRIRFQLASTLKETSRLIGNCGLRLKTAHAQEGDIGFELDPDLWGHGYASEGARALVEFGFSQLGLHRISARCLAENVRSARVLEKLGMRLEGQLRENEFFKGRWWNTLLYGLLEHEWQARQADAL